MSKLKLQYSYKQFYSKAIENKNKLEAHHLDVMVGKWGFMDKMRKARQDQIDSMKQAHLESK